MAAESMLKPVDLAGGAGVRQGACLAEMRGIWKSFPGVVANRGTCFDLREGEVHALLGENGAGKTTLMNILSGLYRPDAGAILIGGKGVHFRSPSQAIAAGIGMVHQHFRLVDKLTVAANVHLGWADTPFLVSQAGLVSRTEALSHRFGLAVDPRAKIWQLSVGEQQRAEILRVLARGARVLILDEPTAVLTPNEVTELFHVLRGLAAHGHAIVFISHKLGEVLEISDRITVLRGGSNVATCSASECEPRMLARLMVGSEVIRRDSRRTRPEGHVVVELQDLCALGDRGQLALKDVSLSIRSHEIVGIAGVAGNGQAELAEVITGLRRQFADSGIGHIPEDRTGSGMAPDASIAENAVLREYRKPPIKKGLRLLRTQVRRVGEQIMREADIRAPSVEIPVGNLSGGNQQRLLARREMRVGSRLVAAVHPTRGLDVAATEAVRQSLLDHRDTGCAVLLISEDLDEVLAVSDRIVVMYEGRMVGEFDAGNADREKIGLLMGGQSGG
jgi:ABC-type uncharacterized transport system ATPase subunit